MSTPVAQSATHQELLDVVRSALMASVGGEGSLLMGLEMEFIPLTMETGERIPLARLARVE